MSNTKTTVLKRQHDPMAARIVFKLFMQPSTSFSVIEYLKNKFSSLILFQRGARNQRWEIYSQSQGLIVQNSD